MKNFWSKTGWTCMAFVPVIASLFAQIAMGAIVSIILSVKAVASGMDYMDSMNYIMEQAMQASSIMVFVYHILSIPIFGVWYYFGCGRPKFKASVKQIKPVCIPATIVLATGLNLFANGFIFLGNFLFPEAIARYEALMEQAGMGQNFFTIFAAVCLAPIGEEILCRGIAWHYASKVVKGMKSETAAFWIVNCITALGFGIMHANLIQGTYAFFLGLGIGFLRHRYNSLLPAMFAHFVVNAISSFLPESTFAWIPETLVAAILFTTVSIIIIASGTIIELKGHKKEAVAVEAASVTE